MNLPRTMLALAALTSCGSSLPDPDYWTQHGVGITDTGLRVPRADIEAAINLLGYRLEAGGFKRKWILVGFETANIIFKDEDCTHATCYPDGGHGYVTRKDCFGNTDFIHTLGHFVAQDVFKSTLDMEHNKMAFWNVVFAASIEFRSALCGGY